MRKLRERIEVDLCDGRPQRLIHPRRTLVVERTLEWWVLQGRWWAREERRVYYRVLAHPPRRPAPVSTVELCRRRLRGRRESRWTITRLLD